MKRLKLPSISKCIERLKQMIKSFDIFEKERQEPQRPNDTAGIAIVLKAETGPMILLVHPTNSSWQKPTMGIPKGRLEVGESPEDAAFRETFEETGISISRSQVEPGIHTVEVWKDQTFKNNIYYLICQIEDPSEIGLSGTRVPASQLQTDEIDWAGFIDINEAYGKVSQAQRLILDRLR